MMHSQPEYRRVMLEQIIRDALHTHSLATEERVAKKAFELFQNIPMLDTYDTDNDGYWLANHKNQHVRIMHVTEYDKFCEQLKELRGIPLSDSK